MELNDFVIILDDFGLIGASFRMYHNFTIQFGQTSFNIDGNRCHNDTKAGVKTQNNDTHFGAANNSNQLKWND